MPAGRPYKTGTRPDRGDPLDNPVLELSSRSQQHFEWIKSMVDPRFVGEADNLYVCILANLMAQYEEAPFDVPGATITKMDTMQQALGLGGIGRKKLAMKAEDLVSDSDTDSQDELNEIIKQ